MSLEAVREVYEQELKKGDIWYPISQRWWNTWREHTGFATGEDGKDGEGGGPEPGPISNDDLKAEGKLGELGALGKDLEEKRHFVWVNDKVWSLLEKKFGGGPGFPRKVIARGIMQETSIERYPIFAEVSMADPENFGEPKEEPKVEMLSCLSTLQDLSDSLLDGTDESKEVRVWMWGKNPEADKEKNSDAAEESTALEAASPENSAEGATGTEDAASPENSAEGVTGTEDAPPAETWLLRFDKHGMEVKLEDQMHDFPEVPRFLIDVKKDDGLWCRNSGTKKDWRDFAVGDVIDALDTANKWYESTIRDVKPDKILVHYEGWESRWDAWIDRDSPNLAPKNTHTTGPYQSSSTGYSRYGTSYGGSTEGTPIEIGAVGLRNLGNTCFMNSTLQCLSNTPGLTDFFVENKHKAQINRDNPLGWNGRVATEYGNLLHEIWGGKYSTVSPNKFKAVMGEIQPRFAGYQQHDSSELLSFLLDGLHEDLNRVKKKPFTQSVDSNGRPDALVSREAWRRHLLRNQSIIVDMLQGQLKSQVDCPDCDRVSVTFDPFMFLSVPLPESDSSLFTVKYIPSSKSKMSPKLLEVKLNKHSATAEQMRKAIGKMVEVDPAELMVVELWKNKIYQRFSDITALGRPGSENLFVYHIPELTATSIQSGAAVTDTNGAMEGASGEEDGLKSGETEAKGNPYYFITLQTHFMTDKTHFKAFGFPLIIPVEAAKVNAYPQSELRKLLRDTIGPFLTGGKWEDGEDDCETYLLDLMDGSARSCYNEIELTHEDEKTINLHEKVSYMRDGSDFAIGLFFKLGKKDRYEVDQGLNPRQMNGTEKPKEIVKLGDCLKAFTTKETLPESEAWYCSNCKKHQCADKQMSVWTLPDVLILHLKRFSYNTYSRDKIDSYVDFPIEGLDMGQWLVNPEHKDQGVYDLFAVSNHFGGLGGGHYTAYAKNIVNKKWYNLDDSSVSEVSPEACKTKAAYVLFYKKRSKGPSKTQKPEDYEPLAEEG